MKSVEGMRRLKTDYNPSVASPPGCLMEEEGMWRGRLKIWKEREKVRFLWCE